MSLDAQTVHNSARMSPGLLVGRARTSCGWNLDPSSPESQPGDAMLPYVGHISGRCLHAMMMTASRLVWRFAGWWCLTRLRWRC